jgi:cation diffusion facilitator CzcD-associated flavoprotein CzcO
VYPAAAKLADWLENYAKALDLDIWTSAEATSARLDEAVGKWVVEVRRKGRENRIFRVNHIILCLGPNGGLKKMPSIPGMVS